MNEFENEYVYLCSVRDGDGVVYCGISEYPIVHKGYYVIFENGVAGTVTATMMVARDSEEYKMIQEFMVVDQIDRAYIPAWERGRTVNG